jgi:hypothetical protein
MSSSTRNRYSAATPALPAAFHAANRRSDQHFLFDTNEPLFRTPNFATHTKKTTSIFLFDANECLSRTSNFAIYTKQTTSSLSTSFFLFDTNERSPIFNLESLLTTHYSLITTHQPPIPDTGANLRWSIPHHNFSLRTGD